MNIKVITLLASIIITTAVATPGWAQRSQEEVARLGSDLTPIDAKNSSNSDGTLLSWSVGITSPPAASNPGKHTPDPYPDTKL